MTRPAATHRDTYLADKKSQEEVRKMKRFRIILATMLLGDLGAQKGASAEDLERYKELSAAGYDEERRVAIEMGLIPPDPQDAPSSNKPDDETKPNTEIPAGSQDSGDSGTVPASN